MPPALACKFTVSELAVLRIVGDEVRQHGQCARCVDEIVARAGVCRRMVQNAIREAARLGLLAIEERRREGRHNLPTSSGSSRRSGRPGWPGEGGRAVHPAVDAKFSQRIRSLEHFQRKPGHIPRLRSDRGTEKAASFGFIPSRLREQLWQQAGSAVPQRKGQSYG